jgi:hypothetical protein
MVAVHTNHHGILDLSSNVQEGEEGIHILKKYVARVLGCLKLIN